MINIYKSFLVLTVVVMYTGIYSLVVRCEYKREAEAKERECVSNYVELEKFFPVPLEISILRRENFNRHYSIGAHYIALILSDSPIVLSGTLLFTVSVSFLSNLLDDLNV